MGRSRLGELVLFATGVIVPYPTASRCEVGYSAPKAGRAAEGLFGEFAPGSATTWKIESKVAPEWQGVEGLRCELFPSVYQKLCTRLWSPVI
jgi:hypothetical protein